MTKREQFIQKRIDELLIKITSTGLTEDEEQEYKDFLEFKLLTEGGRSNKTDVHLFREEK